MEIEISKDVFKKIERASKEMGLDERALILRAIKFYLYTLKSYIDLKEELGAWERAGVEDLVKFEKQI